MRIKNLIKKEKIEMVKSRMNNYQRKYYELTLDLLAQKAIDGKETYIDMTEERLKALDESYNAMENELKSLEKEGE